MKKFVVCLLALSVSFATIGCGGEKKDAPADTPAVDGDNDGDGTGDGDGDGDK